MTSIPLFNDQGQSQGNQEIKKHLIVAKVNQKLLSQAIRVYLSNLRHAKAKIKNRGEISGSTRKIWAQKGTGRARHGDRRAPIFVGGGKSHGPTGLENFSLRLPKKMKKKAFITAFSQKISQDQVKAITTLSSLKPKTALADHLFREIYQPAKGKKMPKILLVCQKPSENLQRAVANLSYLKLTRALFLNPLHLHQHKQVILSLSALKYLEEKYQS